MGGFEEQNTKSQLEVEELSDEDSEETWEEDLPLNIIETEVELLQDYWDGIYALKKLENKYSYLPENDKFLNLGGKSGDSLVNFDWVNSGNWTNMLGSKGVTVRGRNSGTGFFGWLSNTTLGFVGNGLFETEDLELFSGEDTILESAGYISGMVEIFENFKLRKPDEWRPIATHGREDT